MITQRFLSGMHARLRETPSPRGSILYIHGLGESGLCLENIMEHPLLHEFSQLAVDLPGYGKSLWPKKPLKITEQADLLEEWLSSNNAGQVIAIGHSMGGVIGTFLCERHPERVLAYINVEGNISLDDCTFSCVIAEHSFDEFIEKDWLSLYNSVKT